MKLTERLKIKPCPEMDLIHGHMEEYVALINKLISDASELGDAALKQTSRTVKANLPSSVKSEAIRQAKSMYGLHKKRCKKYERAVAKNPDSKIRKPKLPQVKKPICQWNNQNNEILSGEIRIPLWDNDRSSRHNIPVFITDEQREKLSGKTGQLRIVRRNNDLFAEVTYSVDEPECKHNGIIMGVDLGIKCPAVSYINDGSIKFYGNGRKNRWLRMSMRHRRRKLQAAGKNKVVKRISDKESRIMKDIDHKLSREIVNEAIKHNVTIIRLEKLDNIRKSTRKSRKNNSRLSKKQRDYNNVINSWSFYRLAKLIEYKARQAGIEVQYVDPAYTSQRCPVCGELNKSEGRNYECGCGYHGHRDVVGSINICYTEPISSGSAVRYKTAA